MLRTRLVVGTLLAAAAVALLAADGAWAPFFPGLFALAMLVGAVAVRELGGLLPADARPRTAVVLPGVLAVLAVNWLPAVEPAAGGSPWLPVVAAFAVVVLAAFLAEIATYTGPGSCVSRVAYTVFAVGYLGVLPSFLLRLRWLPADVAGVALLLAIFVPKCCDIGAYFTGRIFGRTPFAPRLSPKKTWEGFAGGMAAAAGTAVGLSYVGPVFRGGAVEAAAFGLAVGLAGVFGDLAESVIKRDAHAKDAAASVPGFGGVLDVIDSVVFAAPVVYLWLAR